MGLVESICLGLCGGLMNTIRNDYDNIIECFFSCDSWVLKVEKALSYVGFIMGATGPGHLVFLWMHKLINKISIQYFGLEYDNNPLLFNAVAFMLSNFGQQQLDEIWGIVRTQSLCLMFHNCRHPALQTLSEWKNSYCNVPVKPEDLYRMRKQSGCEQIFNEVPLIVLSLCMGAMFVLTEHYKIGQPKMHVRSKGDEMVVHKAASSGQNPSPDPVPNPGPADPVPNPGPSDPVPNPGPADPVPNPRPSDPVPNPGPSDPVPNPGPADPVPNPSPADPVPNPGPADPVPNPSPADPVPNPSPADPVPSPGPADPVPSPSDAVPNPGSSGSHGGDGGGGDNATGDPNPTQPFHTICPLCKKHSTISIINPTPVFCSGACADRASLKTIIDEMVKKCIMELLDEIQKCLCPQCKSSFGARMGISVECDDCGKSHPSK